MTVLIRGAGDLASGVALRLCRAGLRVIMTEQPKPTAIRRTVCFSEAVRLGETSVESQRARLAQNLAQAREIMDSGDIALLVDPDTRCLGELRPEAVVDAVLAKRNTGTRITDALAVIALGPGFTAGSDCHAVIETMRGHTLGRAIYSGSALPDTGVPGELGGYGSERLLRAPCDGVFSPLVEIGSLVKAGQAAALIDGEPMLCLIDGVLRGILPEGSQVKRGMKSGDIDPRGRVDSCYEVSDKSLAIAGGALEALLYLTGALKEK